jgi:hypothetical protein
MLTILWVVVLSAGLACATPSILTANGSLTMRIAGASLTLSPDSSAACGQSSSGLLVGPSDLSGVVSNVNAQVAGVQNMVFLSGNYTSALFALQQGQVSPGLL